jgi:DNA-binding MarR family transcriptional regulator
MEKDHVDRFLEQFEGLQDLDYDVEGIVERIAGIDKRLRRAMEETLAEHGLTYGEWHLLSRVRNSGEHCSPGDLASDLDLSSGAMTNRLDRLEQAGLVRRRPDPSDRRGVRVELTRKGERVYVESGNAQARKEALFASSLSKREQQQLNALLRKLMLSFEKAKTPAAARR